MNSPQLSLVCPAYNEAGHLYSLLQHWFSFLKSQNISFEIVVCNDGSTDATWAEIERAMKIGPEIRGISLIQNQGAGFAMAEAIRHSKGEIVVTTDSDGQFFIEDACSFYRHLSANPSLDAVIGTRTKKIHAMSSSVGTRVSSTIANCLFGSRLEDFNCALKAVRGDLARRIPFEAKGLNYSTELSYWLQILGARYEEKKVIQHNRQSGISSVKFFKTARARLFFMAYLFLKRICIRMKIIVDPKDLKNV